MKIDIQKLRKRLMLSQTGFGDLLGISRQCVWSYERAGVYPSYKIMKKLVHIAEENGIELSFFITEFNGAELSTDNGDKAVEKSSKWLLRLYKHLING